MPKKVEEKLKKEAAAKGMSGKAADRYVYGTMNKLGMMNGPKKAGSWKEDLKTELHRLGKK